MACKSGKAKTRKSVAKRFKVTGTGKLVRRCQGARHLLQHKSAKRRRRLMQDQVVDKADVARIRECLPFG